MSTDDTAIHWDSAYAQGDTTRSWYQEQPVASLELFEAVGLRPDDSVIDVGGGASVLVDALLDRAFTDLTVLDVSANGIAHAQQRLGPDVPRVQWVVADVLAWEPPRRYRVWHDRAVFHFLTTEDERVRYLRALDAGTGPGSVAVVGCFAPDGPTHCSGLPVARYDAAQLAAVFGAAWTLAVEAREEHRTPSGGIQPFTWVALQRD